jgi:hypothetical protein
VTAGPSGSRRADWHRCHSVVDQVGELLDRHRARARRQCERHVDRSVDRVPGAAGALPHSLWIRLFEPLHPVDELDRRTDHKIRRTVESTPKHHRFTIASGPPRGGTGGGRLHGGCPLIVAESLRQRREQGPACRTLGPGRGDGSNRNRLQRRTAGHRDGHDDAECAYSQDQRDDQHRARWPLGAGHCVTPCSACCVGRIVAGMPTLPKSAEKNLPLFAYRRSARRWCGEG